MAVLLDLGLAYVLDVTQRIVNGTQFLMFVHLGSPSHEALQIQAVGHFEALIAANTSDRGWLASWVAVTCAILQ